MISDDKPHNSKCIVPIGLKPQLYYNYGLLLHIKG